MYKFFLFLLSLVVFLSVIGLTLKATSADHPLRLFESSHERSTYALTESIIQRQSFELTPDQAKFGSPDVGISHDKYYSLFPPGVSFALYPFYQLGAQHNLLPFIPFASVALFSVGSFFLLYMICRQAFKLSVWASLFAALTFCIGSSSLSYALTIYQHLYTTFFLLLGFFSAWKFQKSKKLPAWIWSAVTWIACGVVVWFDYPNAMLVLPILVYHGLAFFHFETTEEKLKIQLHLSVLFTSIFFIGLIGLLGYWQFKTFGSWLQPSNTLKRYDSSKVDDTTKLTSTEAKSSTSTTKGVAQVFTEQNIPNSLYEITIAPDKGLFIFSPIFVLAILGATIELKKHKTEATWLLILISVNFFIYMSFGDPWGGWAFGPRYLIPAMAWMAVFVGSAASNFSRRFVWRLLVLLLFIVSVAFSIAGALTTTLLPPKVEAVFLKMDYGLEVNKKSLLSGQTYSLVYHTFVQSKYSLLQYYFGIVGAVAVFGILLTLVAPHLEKHDA